jgi:membrane protease YdiL (CAAX protease family)
MNSDVNALIAFLSSALLFSLFWGRVTRLSATSSHMTALVRLLMRFSMSNAELIRAYLIWLAYLFTGLIASALYLAIFRVNILLFFRFELGFFAYVVLGLIAQTALASLILLIVGSVKPRLNWYAIVMSTPWVRVFPLLPRYVRVAYPLSGAFIEELFFRGTIFLILVQQFPWVDVWAAILISTLLFVVQQSLNTSSWLQGFMMSIGAVTISVVGCLLFLLTDSFLPPLLCHEMYVIFYFGQGKSSRNAMPAVGGTFFDKESGPAF